MQFDPIHYETLIDNMLNRFKQQDKLSFSAVFEFRSALITETEDTYPGSRCFVLPEYNPDLMAYDTTIDVVFPNGISYNFHRIIKVI